MNARHPNDQAGIPLAAEFPAVTEEQWRRLVEASLKGGDFETRLVHRTHEGLRIAPISPRRADAMPVPGRAPAAPWQVLQRVDHPDPAAANMEALHDLENGASGLALVFAGSVGAHGFGLATGAVERALEGVYLDAGIAIECDPGPRMQEAAAALAALVKARGIAPKDTQMRFGLDPLGAAAATGQSAQRLSDAPGVVARLASELAAQGFAGPFVAADARAIHNAGGSETQELAFALACAVAYLRALEAGGIALNDARRFVFFRLCADADQFLTMAKFRSLRTLWARVEDACGLSPQPVFVSAETAWRMMTARDVHVNMLRTTIAAFAAGLGGADAVTVLPFTAARGLPDRFARRVARNTQLILLEESNLAKVADPAAGSGGIEDLTDKLCAAAWTQFQEIEAAGGVAAALEGELIQTKVAQTRTVRERAIATRRDPLTGTSKFAHLAESAPHVLAAAPAPLPGPPPQRGREHAEFVALSSVRLAEPFERLRDASDRALQATGKQPKIFLANLGRASDFTARAGFARSLFEAGGIAAVEPGLSEEAHTGREIVEAFKASGARIACLCSSDEVYAREAVEVAKALTAAGATHVYMAGRPGANEAALRAAGVKDFVYASCDALAVLRACHDILGIK
jgi:methylmalonyl-CoA mutase